MKSIKCADWGVLALRFAVGIIFIVAGVAKWKMWSAPPEMNVDPLFKFLSIVEPLGGLALIIGFLTQWAAGGLALIMFGAILFKMNVWHIGFNTDTGPGWSYDLVLLASNIAIICWGAGKYSLDHMWCGKK